MDGGGRFLGSLSEWISAPLAPLFARPLGAVAGVAPHPRHPRSRPLRRPPSRGAAQNDLSAEAFFDKARPLARPGVGTFALLAVLLGAGALGVVHSGLYEELVDEHGAPYDAFARAIGFPIDQVTISGETRLDEREILAQTGVDRRNSLLFLDVGDVRRRLMELSLVKSARVMKFYPNRLVIAIDEREPAALWQLNGKVKVVAADGTAIDDLTDERFLGLPFVVGDGADKRLPEFLALVRGLGDLGPRVKSGVLVAGRRWSLMMTNGVEVKLPEYDPGTAVSLLTKLQRESRILDKDVTSVDLRLKERIAVRLTEQGVATRAASTARKPAKSGAHT
jgi:cell division protein FtsQ